MASVGQATIRIVVSNESALRKLAEVAALLDDLQEDLPWRDEPARASEALEYARTHLVCIPD